MTLIELQQAYRGARVFLTGHTGFKGAWLTVLLEQLGAEVHGYSLAPEARSLYRQLEGDALCVRSHHADLNHYDWLAARIAEARPHYVLHLAAQSLVRPATASPATPLASTRRAPPMCSTPCARRATPTR
jgi:CDP-glucose 4,6-dehydratase